MVRETLAKDAMNRNQLKRLKALEAENRGFDARCRT